MQATCREAVVALPMSCLPPPGFLIRGSFPGASRPRPSARVTSFCSSLLTVLSEF